MHDIKAIRDDFEGFALAMGRRTLSEKQAQDIQAILAIDEALREAKTRKQEAEAGRNAASKAIGAAKAQKNDAEATRLMEEVARLKGVIEQAGGEEAKLDAALFDILAGLPNLPSPDAPDGADEHGNVEVRRWYKVDGAGPPNVELNADHVTLGEGLGMMDFEAAARMSGARFVVLKGDLARLERALAAFMLDLHVEQHGYEETNPPFLVKDEAMFGTGQLPKFFDDQFKAGAEHWLIPTAEVSLTNTVREQILDEKVLPLRLTADTPCFRAEAGSAGRDTRGMIRMHQFRKVELVSVTRPEDSAAEHERKTRCAEEVLKRLELPFRTMALCCGDMGFGARKTYDLEVWLPSQGTYREISSISNCGDFQARRMNARLRRGEGAKPEFVHTLNGSGLAVGRTLVAILENYQRADGSIGVPAALVAYMGGKTQIVRA
ncbi:MAG: serine--tRNA ligase [Caulobacterales bacterium]